MKISIIIPVYNCERFLHKCLNSVINQTYKDLDIIIVNDGSTDKSLNIIEEYANKDKRIKVINQENKGGVIARKNGILKSTGDYCLIIDSDDWLDLDTVKIVVNYLSLYNEVDIVKFRYITEPMKKIQNKYFNDNQKCKLVDITKDCFIYDKLMYTSSFNNIWNCLFKKELFDFNSPVYYHIVHKGEDLQINLQLYIKAKKILLTNEVLYHYYINPLGITHGVNMEKIFRNLKDLLYLSNMKNEVAKILNEDINNEIIKQRYIISIVGQITNLFRNKEIKKIDLKKIENEMQIIGSIKYVEDINIDKINFPSFLHKNIAKNLLNHKMIKNYKYKYLFYIYYKYWRK